jgi:hypothetical protein
MTVDEFPAHIKVDIIAVSTWNMWNKPNLYTVYVGATHSKSSTSQSQSLGTISC